MESTPSYCINQYNVGVLDGVGVGLLWVYVLRWILLVSFNDDINLLFCLPNPAEDAFYQGWKHALFFTTDILVPFGSLVYTIFQAVRCGEKLLSCLIVFVNLYEVMFKVTRLKLNFMTLGFYLGGIVIYTPDVIVSISSGIAIGYGGQIRNIGIAGLVTAGLFSFCGNTSRGKVYTTVDLRHETSTIVGAFILVYCLIYPIIIACFITVVVRDNSQWIPRPQSILEYILLVLRIITGFGISDILKLLILKIYRCFKPSPIPEDKSLILNELYWWGQKHETIVRITNRQRIHGDGHYEILS
ncbi:hypothetical protein BGZ76_004305 [Entomortierella beljakovae]|nr:hypothetical protein BGZ76_004305 [Entomortierella beljakovae]